MFIVFANGFILLIHSLDVTKMLIFPTAEENINILLFKISSNMIGLSLPNTLSGLNLRISSFFDSPPLFQSFPLENAAVTVPVC